MSDNQSSNNNNNAAADGSATAGSTTTTTTNTEQNNNKSEQPASSGNEPKQPAGVPSTETARSTTVAETVPNTIGSRNIDVGERDVIDQQRAVMDRDARLLQAESDRANKLEKQVKELWAREEERKAEESRKRKRQEDEEEQKRRRTVDERRAKLEAVVNNAMETIRSSSGGAVDDADIAADRARLLELTKTAEGQEKLDKEYGGMLQLAVRASVGAAKQREENRKRELREQFLYAQQRLMQPPATSFSVSGGSAVDMRVDEPLSFSNQSKSDDELRTEKLGREIAEQGVVRASSNIFDSVMRGSSTGGSRNPFAVSEQVGQSAGQQQQQPSREVAAPGVDMHAKNWAEQVMNDFVTQTSMIPSEEMMRRGGVEAKTRVVASANGAHTRETTYEPRLSQPMRGRCPFTMEQLDPQGFDQIVKGVQAAFAFNGHKIDEGSVRHAERVAARSEQGKFLYLEPYRGPIREDGLQYTDVY